FVFPRCQVGCPMASGKRDRGQTIARPVQLDFSTIRRPSGIPSAKKMRMEKARRWCEVMANLVVFRLVLSRKLHGTGPDRKRSSGERSIGRPQLESALASAWNGDWNGIGNMVGFGSRPPLQHTGRNSAENPRFHSRPQLTSIRRLERG